MERRQSKVAWEGRGREGKRGEGSSRLVGVEETMLLSSRAKGGKKDTPRIHSVEACQASAPSWLKLWCQQENLHVKQLAVSKSPLAPSGVPSRRQRRAGGGDDGASR